MNYWNYRIVRSKFSVSDYEEESYEIHEVYYDNNNCIWGWTANPVMIYGDSYEDLHKTYKLYGEAFKRPILDKEELEKLCNKTVERKLN